MTAGAGDPEETRPGYVSPARIASPLGRFRRSPSCHQGCKEVARARLPRRDEDVPRRPLLDDLATDHEGDIVGDCADEAEFMAYLRLARQRLMLWLAFRDLNGMARLDEVTHSLSHFAQFAANDCIAFIRKDL